jgi:chromosome segregation ATPase
MARLSGLPSEHHHEGPGDAPRRRRGRPSKSSLSSSQSTQEEITVTSGKRAASPLASQSQSKRTKRVQTIIEEEDEDDDGSSQLEQEFQQSVTRIQYLPADTVPTEIQSSPIVRRTRRASEPVVAAYDEDDELAGPATQPLPGLTPHLDRIGASRAKFASRRRERMSMPAQLHVERVDDYDINGHRFQYAPLTAVLDGRTRRRLRRSHLSQEVNEIEDSRKRGKKQLLELRRELKKRDDKIQDLEFRLEASRLGNIQMSDADHDDLAQQLDDARRELDELRNSAQYMGSSDRDLSRELDGSAEPFENEDDDDEDFMLVEPTELNMSQELEMEYAPNGPYASRVLELSQEVTLEHLPSIKHLRVDELDDDEELTPQTIHDQAVERYEREIQRLMQETAEAVGALRVITIEVQNLGFLKRGASSADILSTLRTGFAELRTAIEKYFPNETEGITNEQLLRKIPKLFNGIFFELKEKTEIAQAAQDTEVLLRRQYEGVLDLLGEAEERKVELDKKVYTLDKGNEEKQRTIIDLEERVQTLTDFTEDQEADMRQKDLQIDTLVEQVQEKDTDLERLRESLETYRTDVETLTQTTTELEAGYKKRIERMEGEHADIVADLQAQLGVEQEGREAAEDEAAQKTEFIEELQGRVDTMEAEFGDIDATLADLREKLEQETAARSAAEAQNEKQADVIYNHTNTIENLTEQINDLTESLEQAKTNIITEREQRETTEGALDEANDKIEELNDKVHQLGIQTNELRSKLFQVQQEKEQEILELQAANEEREVELTEQLNSEQELREGAQQAIVDLEKDLTTLRESLATSEADLVKMTEARDQLEEDRELQTGNLNGELAEMESKYAALESSTSSEITSLQAEITDLTNEIARKQAEIQGLTERFVEAETAHEEEKAALDTNIATLERDLAEAQADNEAYRKENESLSDRVGREAVELLTITNAHADEAGALKVVIETQNDTIAELQNQNANLKTEHETILVDKDAQIEELHLLADDRAEKLVRVEAARLDVVKEFAKFEQDTRETIDRMTLQQRVLQEQNEALAEDLKKRGADAVAAVRAMKVKGLEVKTTGVDLHRVATGKVGKITEKVKVGKKSKSGRKVAKRQWDSGFGVDENVEEQEIDGAEIGEAA